RVDTDESDPFDDRSTVDGEDDIECVAVDMSDDLAVGSRGELGRCRTGDEADDGDENVQKSSVGHGRMWDQMRSISVPVPSPPPQHIETRPYRPPVRSSS
ncbi:MAG: hypothetical protein RLZ86_1789, partial [Actinomycetota bacterium]